MYLLFISLCYYLLTGLAYNSKLTTLNAVVDLIERMPSPGFSLLVLLLFSDIAEVQILASTRSQMPRKRRPWQDFEKHFTIFFKHKVHAMLGFKETTIFY